MLTRKLVTAAVAALGFAAIPAMSATIAYVEVQALPPALQTEASPAPIEGQVWIPGYWDYRDNTYTWVQGRFEPARKGYVFITPTYEQRDGRWRMYAGRWVSEEEHGGLRNRVKDKADRVKSKVKAEGDSEEHGGLRNRMAKGDKD
jgi:hypothetical protein